MQFNLSLKQNKLYHGQAKIDSFLKFILPDAPYMNYLHEQPAKYIRIPALLNSATSWNTKRMEHII